MSDKLYYNTDGCVHICDKYATTLSDFLENCTTTGYQSPIVEGEFFLYIKGKGKCDINSEGHIGKPDGKLYPEYDIFINQVDVFSNLLNKLKEQRRKEYEQKLPNIEKRRLNLAGGGYGTTVEQLDIIANQGIDAFIAHRQAVDAALPIEG